MMIEVTSVQPYGGRYLLLTFNDDDYAKVFDTYSLRKLPVFSSLENPKFFNAVLVDEGAVGWNEELQLDPDVLFEESVAVEEIISTFFNPIDQ